MKTITRPFVGLSVPVVALFLSFFAAVPAQAHHLMDGKPVTTAAQSFLSGIAHPVIGIDHLVMIVAIGVLAAAMRPGFLLAAVFVVAAMAGTGVHLLNLSLPGSEVLIALSVLVVGILLALRKTPNQGLVLGICAVAGMLHGYAYGESIFGAESSLLVAYLVGFTVVQLAVAGIAYAIAKSILRKNAGEQALVLRPAGFVVAGAGMALLATQIVAMALPIH
jgi:urease accessory protein